MLIQYVFMKEWNRRTFVITCPISLSETLVNKLSSVIGSCQLLNTCRLREDNSAVVTVTLKSLLYDRLIYYWITLFCVHMNVHVSMYKICMCILCFSYLYLYTFNIIYICINVELLYSQLCILYVMSIIIICLYHFMSIFMSIYI